MAALLLLGHRLKRWLYLLHRWCGVVLCAFFALWFVSGVVMMYIGYPKLTPAERLQHLPALDMRGLLPPAAAMHSAGLSLPLKEVRLAAASGGQPVYLLQTDAPPNRGKKGSRQGRVEPALALDARSGERLPATDPARALASAQAWAPGLLNHYQGSVDEDAYTHSRALDAHRPLHIVELGDDAATWLYVSGSTGEVVRDASRAERWWNWVGAWLHWLYPFRGNWFDPYYSDIVIALSLAGIVLTFSGSVVGVWRWRFGRRYASGQRTPYRERWMRWHHISGLLFALVTFTWILSGLLSINPWQVFDSGAPKLAVRAYTGGALRVERLALPSNLPPVRELIWTQAAGHTLLLAQREQPRPQVYNAATLAPLQLDPAELRQAAAQLLPGAQINRIDILTDYDTYYYARAAHTMLGHVDKPLPIWRVIYNDAHTTWVHLDPHTGSVLQRLDQHTRVKRWLFAFLHSWDWLPLLQNRPLWDGLLILLSLGGVVLSASGVIIGWRRLRRKLGVI